MIFIRCRDVGKISEICRVLSVRFVGIVCFLNYVRAGFRIHADLLCSQDKTDVLRRVWTAHTPIE